jgi:phospholipase C
MVGKNVMRLQFGLFSAAGLLLLGLNACGGGSSSSSSTPPPEPKIQHVVIIFQENRTPDNLFHDQNLINAGADIASSGTNSTGKIIPLTPLPLASDYGPNHNHVDFLSMYDKGKMDGADKISIVCNPGVQNCPPPNAQFVYVQTGDVAPYFQMAETYTFADRMFQTNQGPSFPAHQYILSASSAQSTNPNPLYAAENPFGIADPAVPAGCIAPANEVVFLINLATGDESQSSYPCYDHPTLTDTLNNANITWKWYTAKNDPGSIWNAPNAIQHICVPDSGHTTCTGSEWTSNVVIDPTHVLTDIQNGQLPSVSWVIPDGVNSDHAPTTDKTGPAWVASIVNAIGNSQYWPNTAIFISWDDWGGWYDHVAPPIRNAYEYGFRVPLIVVSPFAKAKYISHTTHHFGSILKFIETNWSLPAVGTGTYSDAYSDTDDLSDCFDYNQTPLTFTTIPAAQDREFFLHDHRPLTVVDDD